MNGPQIGVTNVLLQKKLLNGEHFHSNAQVRHSVKKPYLLPPLDMTDPTERLPKHFLPATESCTIECKNCEELKEKLSNMQSLYDSLRTRSNDVDKKLYELHQKFYVHSQALEALQKPPGFFDQPRFSPQKNTSFSSTTSDRSFINKFDAIAMDQEPNNDQIRLSPTSLGRLSKQKANRIIPMLLKRQQSNNNVIILKRQRTDEEEQQNTSSNTVPRIEEINETNDLPQVSKENDTSNNSPMQS
jgi:hypothetical protein